MDTDREHHATFDELTNPRADHRLHVLLVPGVGVARAHDIGRVRRTDYRRLSLRRAPDHGSG